MKLSREWNTRAVLASAPDSRTSRHLREGEAYYWSPAICSLLETIAQEMPRNWIFMPEMCPSESGFWWFSRPISMVVEGQRIKAIHAVSWGIERYRDRERHLALTSWTQTISGDLDSYGVGLLASGVHFDPDGRCDHVMTLETSIAISGVLESRESDRTSIAAVLLTAAGLTFLDQRILVAPQQQVERHARRRLERAGFQHEPLVRVVELRRKQARSEHHGNSEPVEWSHQWIVSGHWRQQWYPSLNANQPRWIMPYIKGPESKPLKPPRAKVFAVVR